MERMPPQVRTIIMMGDYPETIEMLEAILHIVQTTTPQLLDSPVELEYRLQYKYATVRMHAYVEYRANQADYVVNWRVSMEEWTTEDKITRSHASHIYVGNHHEIGRWLTEHIESLEKVRDGAQQRENYGDW